MPLSRSCRCAEAYSTFDVAALFDVLAANLLFRCLDGAQSSINATTHFLENTERWELVSATAKLLGDRVATTSPHLSGHRGGPAQIGLVDTMQLSMRSGGSPTLSLRLRG